MFVGSFTAGRRDIALTGGALDIRADGAHPKLVKSVSSPTFSGRRALANGQQITYVTERAVLSLRPEGLTVTEVAPGVDLERDVLARAEFPLHVSEEVTTMDADLFREDRLGLTLPPAAPHPRIAALRTGVRR